MDPITIFAACKAAHAGFVSALIFTGILKKTAKMSVTLLVTLVKI